MGRVAAWIAVAAGIGGCGDGAVPPDGGMDGRDARPQLPVPQVEEAEECGASGMVPRSGVQMAASAVRFADSSESVDLNGDGFGDNRFTFIGAASGPMLMDRLKQGALALPFELFDGGAAPDPCLKLAHYRGACASAACDFTDDGSDRIALDLAAASRLRALRTRADGALELAGPGYLEVTLPFRTPAISGPSQLVDAFTLPLTVSYVAGALEPNGLALHVGGALQAFRLGQLAARPSGPLNTRDGDSQLDVVFANELGRRMLFLFSNTPDCRTADLDLDGDGFEELCDTIDDGLSRIDTCIDGNGVALRDGDNGLADCSQAMKHGRPRFADGVSLQLVIHAKRADFAP